MGQATGTILNDDTNISISDVARLEGNSGSTNVVFTVRLEVSSSEAVTVAYTTADDTATSGSDYTAAAGTLSFAPGVKSQSITVVGTGDTAVESDETFAVVLSNPTGAVLLKSDGEGTIANDDGLSPPYRNPRLQWDVNGDGIISALDALIVINHLNSNGAGPLPAPSPTAARLYIDVNGDAQVSPLDALNVINYLNINGVTSAAHIHSIGADQDRAISAAAGSAAGLQVRSAEQAIGETSAVKPYALPLLGERHSTSLHAVVVHEHDLLDDLLAETLGELPRTNGFLDTE